MGHQKDGGTRAWLCVAVVFVNYMLMIGASKCFSVIYMMALDRFEGSATATAWVGSLQTVLRLGLGPMVSTLINRFGIRPVVVIGAFGQAIAYIISGLAPSLFVFTLSFGLLMGISSSCVYVPSQFILAYYFEKRRGLAYSIACSGMGVGIFLLPPFYYYVEQGYSFFGAMLIMGGLMLNTLPSGIMFQVPKVDNSSTNREEVQTNNKNDMTHEDDVKSTRKLHEEGLNGKLAIQRDKHKNVEEVDDPLLKSHICTAESCGDARCTSVQSCYPGNKEANHTNEDAVSNGKIPKVRTETSGNHLYLQESTNEKKEISLDGKLLDRNGHIQCLGKSDAEGDQPIFPSAQICNGALNNEKDDQAELSRNYPSNDKQPSKKEKIAIKKRKLFNLKLLCNKPFLTLLLWTAAITLVTSVHSTFNFALMVSHGISENHSAILISVTGITDIIGNIITGSVYDLKVIKRHKMFYYAFFMMVLGSSVILMPIIPSFPVQVVLFALYGMSAAPVCTLRVPLISEAIGKENLPDAVGIMLVTHGSGYVVGPFMGGLIVDNIGSYSLTFYLSGSILCICAILCSTQHVIKYRRQHK